MYKNDYNVKKIINKISSTAFIGSAMFLLDSTIQAIYAGKLLGTNELIALSSCFCLMLASVSIIEGFVAGTIGQITDKYYSKDHEGLQDLVNTSWSIGIIVSIVMTFGGFLIADTLLKLIGIKSEVFDNASIYLKVSWLCNGLVYILFTTLHLLSSLKNKWAQFVYIIPTTILNIAIVPLFCKGYWIFPNWGMKALALVPILTGGIGIILGIYFIYKEEKGLLIKFTRFSLKCDFKAILKRGFPVFLPKFQAGINYIFILYFLNKFDGYASGAFYIISRIDALVCLPGIGIMSGIAVATGMVIRDRKFGEIKNIVKWGATLISPSIIVLAILSSIISKSIMGVFTFDNNIIDIGAKYLKIAALGYLFFIITYISNGILYGIRKKKYVVMISAISIFLIRLPLFSIFTSRGCAIEVIWRIIIVSYIISACLSLLINIIKGLKLKKAISSNEELRTIS